jgi:hypothetical protein
MMNYIKKDTKKTNPFTNIPKRKKYLRVTEPRRYNTYTLKTTNINERK